MGILYVGRKESLELMPTRSLSEEKVEQVFERLQATGAFQSELNDHGSGELIRALGQLPDFALHPLINLGLKEISALLVQEKERHTYVDSLGESPEFHHIIEYSFHMERLKRQKGFVFAFQALDFSLKKIKGSLLYKFIRGIPFHYRQDSVIHKDFIVCSS